MPPPDLHHLSAIVLAAGRSQRTGGPNKLLHPLAGQPLLGHALETVAGLRLSQAIVVTGRDRDAIEHLARCHGLSPVHNALFEEGMGTSIAAGAAALEPGHAGVYIHLGDLPFVTRATFHALADALRNDETGAADAFVPECNGVRGHPVLFRTRVVGELSQLRGDGGARHILSRRVCRRVRVNDPDISRDFDTMEDLALLTRSD